MKQVLFSLIILFPTLVLGQGSQLGPLHLPFEFKIQVNGSFGEVVNPAGPTECDTSPSNFQIDWIIHPGDTDYHFIGDTISLDDRNSDSSFLLIVDTVSKTITKLHFGFNNTFGPDGAYWSIWLRHLNCDSATIFINDSSVGLHMDSVCYYSGFNVGRHFIENIKYLVSVFSIDLSGNFRSITLDAPVKAQLIPGISIMDNDGSIQCSFSSVARRRTLELYNSLGAQWVSIEVPAGAASVSLPHLPSGLYFMRMEGTIVKLAVLE